MPGDFSYQIRNQTEFLPRKHLPGQNNRNTKKGVKYVHKCSKLTIKTPE